MKGKEVKIGLSVIALLLCVFGVVLFTRLRDTDALPKIADKPSSKGKAGSKKKDKEAGKSNQNKLTSPATAKHAAGSHGGPSLRLEVPPEQRSFANSSRNENEEQQDPGDSSSRSAKLSALAGPFGQQGAVDEEPAESVDRYGRRYGLANDSQAGHLGRRHPDDTAEAEAAEEMTGDEIAGDQMADDQVAADDEFSTDDGATRGAGLSLGAGRDAGYGRPADGYRTIEDETAAESVADAEDDPFPSASPAPFAIREPAKSGSLKASAEVQLAPIDETDDASIAGVGAFDRGQYGSGRRPASASLSGQGGFSAVSRKSAAALAAELEQDADLTSDEPFERSTGGAARSGAYFVQAGDSFATISKRVYGTDGYFKALHEYNREQYPNPSMIDVGDEIAVPDVAVLQQEYPGLCPKPRGASAGPRGGAMRLASRGNSARGGRAYLVAEGDTLFDIAKRELGKASRWKEIYDLNQDQLGEDFNYLSPGTELLLPGKGDKPDPVADRPSLDRRRR